MTCGFNEHMFRTALNASTYPKYQLLKYNDDGICPSYHESWPITPSKGDDGILVPQVIMTKETSNVTIFQSQYSFLAGALVVMMVGVSVVVPMFNGFWEHGRNTSLNPLEIAKAFNPPILDGPGSNAIATHLDKNFGAKEVQYGEIVDSSISRDNQIADPSRVIIRSRNQSTVHIARACNI